MNEPHKPRRIEAFRKQKVELKKKPIMVTSKEFESHATRATRSTGLLQGA